MIFDKSLFLDLTTFVSSPFKTGIQRYIYAICVHAQSSVRLIPIKIDENGIIKLLDLSIISIIKDYFEASNQDIQDYHRNIIIELSKNTTISISQHNIKSSFGILLPEVSYYDPQTTLYSHLATKIPEKLFAIVYDFSPWIEPDSFPDFNCTYSGPYHYLRSIRQIPNLAFISSTTKSIFENRINRKPSNSSIVIGGGGDAITKYKSADLSITRFSKIFLVIGTVQHWKGHFLALDVFKSLWQLGFDYHLVFLGAAGNITSDEIAELRIASYNLTGFTWIEKPSDEQIAIHFSYASATLCLSKFEGLCLPFLESLFNNVPVISAKNLPAIEFVNRGYISIEPTFTDLFNTLIKFNSDEFISSLRNEAINDHVPTWSDTIHTLLAWIVSKKSIALSDSFNYKINSVDFYQIYYLIEKIYASKGLNDIEFIKNCFSALSGSAPTGVELIEMSNIISYFNLDRHQAPIIISLMIDKFGHNNDPAINLFLGLHIFADYLHNLKPIQSVRGIPEYHKQLSNDQTHIIIDQLEFDEQFYMENNPDISNAVESGSFNSGWEHYLLHGRKENRPVRTKNSN